MGLTIEDTVIKPIKEAKTLSHTVVQITLKVLPSLVNPQKMRQNNLGQWL